MLLKKIYKYIEKYKKIFIYLILFLVSLIPSFYLFKKGFVAIANGHDNNYHFAQIQDLYNAWKSGNFYNYITHQSAHYFGVGVKLFYAPLSHLLTVILAFILTPFTSDLLISMKIIMYLSIFSSGIFTYLFVKKITNNDIAGLIAAIIYMVFPYRLTNIYLRNAFAETVAIAFVPLCFYGVGSILKMDEIKFKPFFITILGFVCVFLSHNITFIYNTIFVVIYLLFNIKDVIRLFKKKDFIFYLCISVFLMLCFVSPLLFPMLEHKALGIYRVFEGESMNTTLEIIQNKINSSKIFLTFRWSKTWSIDLLIFSLFAIAIFGLSLNLYRIIKKRVKLNYEQIILYNLILIISIILAKKFKINFNVIRGLYIIPIVIFYSLLLKKNDNKINLKNLLIDFSAMLFLTFITIILINNKNIWAKLPSVLYIIQFPWRLWSYVGLFGGIALGILFSIINKYTNAKIIYIYPLLLGLSNIVFMDGNIKNYDIDPNINISNKNTYKIHSCGSQIEYFPTDFYWEVNKNNKSNYYYNIIYNYIFEEDDKRLEEISFYEADLKTREAGYKLNYGTSLTRINEIYSNYAKEYGNYNDYKYKNDKISFNLETYQDVSIRIPRVYYKGYQIKITTNENKIYYLNYENLEGFIIFKTNLSGFVEIEYVGTKSMKLSTSLFGLGIIILGEIYFYNYRRKKEEKYLIY